MRHETLMADKGFGAGLPVRVPSERIIWIDLVRGFCMLAILLHHTEMYYVGEAVIDYRLFVDNALCAFYFISGYLFLKKTPFDIHHKLVSIIKTLIIPYFIFMGVIAIPKALVHGTFVSVTDILFNILLGKESWFITALATAEFIFSILLYLSKHNKWILPTGVLLSLTSIILLTGNKQMIAHNYWNVMDGLLAVTFLYLGYLYHQFEEKIQFHLYYICILIMFLVFSKWMITKNDIYTYLGYVNISNYIVFMVDNIVAVLLIIQCCKLLPTIKPISWMGSHVIVYYFLCGGIPLTLSLLADKIGFSYHEIYMQVIIMLIAVYLVITLLAWLIYKYIPWVTGRL